MKKTTRHPVWLITIYVVSVVIIYAIYPALADQPYSLRNFWQCCIMAIGIPLSYLIFKD